MTKRPDELVGKLDDSVKFPAPAGWPDPGLHNGTFEGLAVPPVAFGDGSLGGAAVMPPAACGPDAARQDLVPSEEQAR
jgi:hypothetical protein